MKKPVSLTDIETLLNNLHIPHEICGRDIIIDKLCSIKRKEPRGLYYLTDEAVPLGEGIESSIIISDKILPGLERLNSFVIVSEPQVVYYKLCRIFLGNEKKWGIHATAIVDSEAQIDPQVYIGPYAVVGKCLLGKGTRIDAHVVIYDNTIVGENVTVEAGSYIGATGVSWVWDESGERVIQPQVGGVILGDECFIGTNVTIVRGSLNEFTEIGRNTLIAHGTKIGHGVRIGAYSHLANNVTVAGSAVIGERCFLGAGSVVSSNIKLAREIVVGAGAVVVQDIHEESVVVAGVPAKVIKQVGLRHRGVPKNVVN